MNRLIGSFARSIAMKLFSILFFLSVGALPAQSGPHPLADVPVLHAPGTVQSSSPANPRHEESASLSSYTGHPEIEGAALTCVGIAMCMVKRRRRL